jgi:hypothetical protein
LLIVIVLPDIFHALSLTFIFTVWFLSKVIKVPVCHVAPLLKLYSFIPLHHVSLAFIVNSTSLFVHDVGFQVTLIVGTILSMLLIIIVLPDIFHALSFTFIFTVWFLSKVIKVPVCHVAPLLKLYSFIPLHHVSLAFTVNVTPEFVHTVGFKVTLVIIGTALSIFCTLYSISTV